MGFVTVSLFDDYAYRGRNLRTIACMTIARNFINQKLSDVPFDPRHPRSMRITVNSFEKSIP